MFSLLPIFRLAEPVSPLCITLQRGNHATLPKALNVGPCDFSIPPYPDVADRKSDWLAPISPFRSYRSHSNFLRRAREFFCFVVFASENNAVLQGLLQLNDGVGAMAVADNSFNIVSGKLVCFSCLPPLSTTRPLGQFFFTSPTVSSIPITKL